MMRLLRLNAGEEPAPSLNAVYAALPTTIPDGDGVELRVPVIPAAGAEGVVPTRGGRTHRMADPGALAAALNAQEVSVRVDFDHRSEPDSPTFDNSTAAEGWAKDFRATAAGAVEATLELSADALAALRRGAYRYLSPALWLKPSGEIVEMSSLALVNNPNMPLDAPAVSSSRSTHVEDENGTAAKDLQAEKGRLKKRQEALDKRALNAAEAAVDRAIEGGRLRPAQKDFALSAIKSHEDGIEAGLDAFEAAHTAESAEVDEASLTRRVGPRGAPKGQTRNSAPAFAVPAGHDVDDEQLELHGQVAEYARKRGISYREAVLEYGALQRG